MNITIDPTATLEYFNERRARYAKKYEVANMWKLEYDEGLASKAALLDVAYAEKGADYRLLFHSADALASAYEQYLETVMSFLKENEPEMRADAWRRGDRDTLFSMEVFVCGQTRVGCAPCSPTKCRRGLRDSKSREWRWLSWDAICLIGPVTNVTELREETGEPGTMCGDGTKSDNGLCVRG
ncbi:unnamed protein product [Caenorhabditis sp. 36 PRJEB53466]|nr:unnamed protein product [Caenorhabditis sp. 36 PRJEB53466]